MKNCLVIALYCFFILLPLPGRSQTDQQTRDQADYFYRHYAFSEAIPLYKSIDEKTFRDNARLGDCYRLTNNPGYAATYYGKAVATDDGSIPDIKLRYGQVLMTLEKYRDAEKWLTAYYRKFPQDRRTKNLVLSCRTAGKRKIATPRGYATFLTDLNTDKNEFAPTIWQNKLVFNSDSTYEIAKKDDRWTGSNFFNIYLASFDSARQIFGGEISAPPLSRKGNIKYHDGPCTFTTEANEMYFTRTRYNRFTKHAKQNKDSIALLNIMVATGYDTAARVFRKIKPFEFNNKKYSVAHPAISPDGRTLIFAANKKGSAGGYDLYICKRQPNGKWLPPENIGNLINTEGDELFPYMPDAKTLYFSSDGQKDCFGGLDVYKSTFNGTAWSQAENLGTPVNSSFDDLSLAMRDDGRASFFSSNRPAQKRGDNIYLFQSKRLFLLVNVKDAATKLPLPGATVKLLEAADTFRARTEDDGSTITALSPKFPYGYKVSVTLNGYDTFTVTANFIGSNKPTDTIYLPVLLSKKQDKPADSSRNTTSNEHRIFFNLKVMDCRTRKPVIDPGSKVNVTFDTSEQRINYYLDAEAADGELSQELFPGKKYMLEISSFDYQALYLTKINTDFRLPSATDTIIFDSVCLEPRKDIINLGVIPFGYDSAILNAIAQARLSKFVKYLTETHPTMKLLIRGHTDCRETKPGYNKLLSERRAYAVMNYFISKGVAANRLKAIGVKDDMPRIPCNNCETGDGMEKLIKKYYKNGRTDCTDTEHAQNRYIDCVILEY